MWVSGFHSTVEVVGCYDTPFHLFALHISSSELFLSLWLRSTITIVLLFPNSTFSLSFLFYFFGLAIKGLNDSIVILGPHDFLVL